MPSRYTAPLPRLQPGGAPRPVSRMHSSGLITIMQTVPAILLAGSFVLTACSLRGHGHPAARHHLGHPARVDLVVSGCNDIADGLR